MKVFLHPQRTKRLPNPWLSQSRSTKSLSSRLQRRSSQRSKTRLHERLRLLPNQCQSRLQLPPLLQTPASLTTKMTPVKQSLLHQSSLRKRLTPYSRQ